VPSSLGQNSTRRMPPPSQSLNDKSTSFKSVLVCSPRGSIVFRSGKYGKHAMQTLRLGRMAVVAGLWLLAACGNGATGGPPAKTVATAGVENTQSSQPSASCKKDSNCASGQRCGFTLAMGCAGRGTCVVERAGNCFDPGGRCGCDGLPVDLFCAVGSSTVFASAPVGFVGGCPKPCTKDAECPSRNDVPLPVCRKGICVQPQNGRID
jgi:hypothetical protein